MSRVERGVANGDAWALAVPDVCSSSGTLAEVVEAYSKFVLPPLDQEKDPITAPVTLVGQSEGLSPLLPAVDQAPTSTGWRSPDRSRMG